MEEMPLSFATLMSYLNRGVERTIDPRKRSNAQTYSMKDLVFSAFAAFFMQSESFLEFQRQMESRQGENNARSLFGVFNIPSVPQIRNVLDKVVLDGLSTVFVEVYQKLKASGYLKDYECLGGHLLIPLDGTEYFSSEKIHCSCCSHRTHKSGKTRYFHTAILPVIVAPEKAEVIALAPEFVTPQDGHEKQDCEIAAAKRWIDKNKGLFLGQPVTILGDDLCSRQPMCEACEAAEMNYIFTCLPETHEKLYEWLEEIDKLGEVKTLEVKHQNKKTQEVHRYRLANQVPLRGLEQTDRSQSINH